MMKVVGKNVLPAAITPHNLKVENQYFAPAFQFPALPVITHHAVELQQWGLIPFWTKTEQDKEKIRTMTFNARGETLFDKPSFREAAKHRRCVLPVDGFFEWREVGGQKIPYYIYPSQMPVFFMGCIYDYWTNITTGEVVSTFSLVTTPANAMMKVIHNSGNNKNRMPLLIAPADIEQWVHPQLDAADIHRLIKPAPQSEMQAHTISKDANYSRRNRNRADIREKVYYDEVEGGRLFG